MLVLDPPVVLMFSVSEAPTPPGMTLSVALTPPVVDLYEPSVSVLLSLVVSVSVLLEESAVLSLPARLEFVPCCVPALTPALTPTVAIAMVESDSVNVKLVCHPA